MKPNLKIEVKTNDCGGVFLILMCSKTGKVYADMELAYEPSGEEIIHSIKSLEILKSSIIRNWSKN